MDALPDKTLGRVASPTRVQGYIASNTNTKRRKTSPSASGFIQVNNEPGRVGIAEGSSDQSFSQEKVAQIDSGYGTSQNTPDTQRSINHDSIPGTSPSPLLGGNGLKVFNKKINPETTARFREIVPELERLLAAHLRDNTARLLWSKPSRVRPKAIRLLTLGITDTDTAEYIVLFCHESEVNRVQGFFNEPIAKGLYEPEDRTVPSFKVLVSGHAFRLRSGETDILVMLGANENEWPTLCGQPVLFEKVGSLADRRKASRAIIGGMIKVIDHTDFTYLYAMTAGHAILGLMDQENETTNTQPQPSGSGQASQKDDSILLDPFGSHLGPVVEDSTVRDEILTSEVQGIVVKTFCTLPILYPSSHDWALVHVTDPKPNKYLPQGINGPPIKRDIVSCYEGFPDTPEQAILMNKSKGDIHGSISEIPARIALGSADDFIDVYVFTPDSSVAQEVVDGYSGSWVIDSSSSKVYGHVVGTDVLGDVYVVPMSSTLRSVQITLDAKSVSLPSLLDFTSIQLEEVVESEEPSSSPISSPMTPAKPFDSGYNSLGPSPSDREIPQPKALQPRNHFSYTADSPFTDGSPFAEDYPFAEDSPFT